MNLVICQAIAARKLLLFGYGDLVRVVEPHVYGVNSAGREMLGAWLRAGYSRTDPKGGWRNYLTDEVHDLQMLDERFDGPRAGYNPDDARMAEVFCRLEGGAREQASDVS